MIVLKGIEIGLRPPKTFIIITMRMLAHMYKLSGPKICLAELTMAPQAHFCPDS